MTVHATTQRPLSTAAISLSPFRREKWPVGNSGAGYNDLTGYKFALIRAQATMYELHQEMTAAGDIDGAARAQLAHHLVGLLLLVETRLQGRWALSMALSLGVRLGRLLG